MWLRAFPTAIGLLRPYQYLNGMVNSESEDYKVTVNAALDIDQYPLPRPEDLMTCLSSFCRFTKLDLSSANQQMPLEEALRPFVTINTHRDLYCFTRLPFGIALAPAIF